MYGVPCAVTFLSTKLANIPSVTLDFISPLALPSKPVADLAKIARLDHAQKIMVE